MISKLVKKSIATAAMTRIVAQIDLDMVDEELDEETSNLSDEQARAFVVNRYSPIIEAAIDEALESEVVVPSPRIEEVKNPEEGD